LEHPRNVLMHTAIRVRGPVIMREFAAYLRDLPYPRHFVDFEAAAFAIPRFEGMRPYQPLPFQWSCHTISEEGASPEHREFLDVTGGDPRHGFAQILLETVGNYGPVLVYSHYEKTRIAELAAEFSDLRPQLLRLIERLVDLLPMARKGFYHPKMLGSWSLKAIVPLLPATATSTTYDDLDDVADGLAAQAAYMNQIDPCVFESDKQTQRLKMLRYCRTDTEGLHRFVEYIQSSLTTTPDGVAALELETC